MIGLACLLNMPYERRVISSYLGRSGSLRRDTVIVLENQGSNGSHAIGHTNGCDIDAKCVLVGRGHAQCCRGTEYDWSDI